MSEQKIFPTGKHHISFSEVKQWSECSYRHKLQHIDKINLDKPGPALSFGTAVHAACEDFLETRQMKPEIAITSLKKAWDEAEDKTVFSQSALQQAEVDATEILAEIPDFMDKTFPNWEFHTAEEQLYEAIDGHDDVKFKGFIDGVLTCDGKRGEKLHWIIDWKTSNRGWLKDKRQDFMTRAQVVLYKNFWQQKNSSVDIKDLRCGFVILKRSAKKTNHCEFLSISAGPITIKKSLKVVNNMITSVKRGIYLKNKNSCKYCVYLNTPHCT